MPVEEAEKYYEENKDRFIKDFKGKFVAIINKDTFRVGDDIVSVASSVYKDLGYQDVFITKVLEEPQVIRLTRPRLVK
jgi:hypothetical protein